MWFLSLAAGVFFGLRWLERRRPLRASADPGSHRVGANAGLSVLTALTAAVVDRPVTSALARTADARRRGLLKRLGLPRSLETALAFLILDYALYRWHVALHRVPALWRTHLVHHTDLDLDTTTALRFHAAEILLSVAWRAALVRALGIGARPLALYQQVLFLCVLFHHSNVRLPSWLEAELVRLVATPRMHGIHHSMVREETDSNWSSVLTVWDRLHGTLELDVPQESIRIGVPAWPEPLRGRRLLALPFTAQPDSWESPGPRA